VGTALTKQEWYHLRVQNIKAVVTMEALLQHVGVDITQSSRAVQVRCPMIFNHAHGDKSKSARVYPDSQTFKCYVCTDKAVDIIGFAELYNNLSFVAAINWFEKTFNIETQQTELIKDLNETMHELLDAGNTDFARLDAKRNYGLDKLRNERDAFTLSQIIALYGVIDDLWYDVKQGNVKYKKIGTVIEQWLTKIREIIDHHEKLDVR